MYMILFVLNDPDQLDEILTAWEEAGVGGITVLPSTGLGRIRQKEGLREDMPLIPSLEDFYHHQGDINHTLFTVVEDETMKDKVIAVTQERIGDLNKRGNGILIILPVAEVHGLVHYREQEEEE